MSAADKNAAMKKAMRATLDKWLDEVVDNPPDGEMGEGATLKLKVYRDDYCTQSEDGVSWGWTIGKARTSSQV